LAPTEIVSFLSLVESSIFPFEEVFIELALTFLLGFVSTFSSTDYIPTGIATTSFNKEFRPSEISINSDFMK
jgi:hypothetical protein